VVQLVVAVVYFLHLSIFHPLELSDRPHKPPNHFWNISLKYRYARYNKLQKLKKWSNVVQLVVAVVYFLHLSSFHPLELSDRPHKPPNHFWNISQKYRYTRYNKHKKPKKWSNVVQFVVVVVYFLHLSIFHPLELSDRPHKPPNHLWNIFLKYRYTRYNKHKKPKKWSNVVQLVVAVVYFLHLSSFHPLELSDRPHKPPNHLWNIFLKYRYTRYNKLQKPKKWSNVVQFVVVVG
jgi:heme/copper-type cytochrome/quinol oxidase subunit 4